MTTIGIYSLENNCLELCLVSGAIDMQQNAFSPGKDILQEKKSTFLSN